MPDFRYKPFRSVNLHQHHNRHPSRTAAESETIYQCHPRGTVEIQPDELALLTARHSQPGPGRRRLFQYECIRQRGPGH